MATESRRFTVTLTPRAVAALENLTKMKSLSQTDITNRAIQTYEFIELELATGKELIFRDQASGDLEKVHII